MAECWDWNTLNATDVPTLWLGALAYTLQIYFDFSGYSDMAIGIAQILGVPIKENFNQPYLATSLSDFWRRWHISLGTWFRTYLYIPLGGNRTHVYRNLFIVFMVTGIWHGSQWNFVIWGAVFAAGIVCERYIRTHLPTLVPPKPFALLTTFIIVFFNWILFRASNLYAAWHYLGSMFAIVPQQPRFTWFFLANTQVLLIITIALLIVFLVPRTPLFRWWNLPSKTIPALFAKSLICIALIAISYIAIINSSYSPFLYFQF